MEDSKDRKTEEKRARSFKRLKQREKKKNDKKKRRREIDTKNAHVHHIFDGMDDETMKEEKVEKEAKVEEKTTL